jgi:site-specific DNA recombinase
MEKSKATKNIEEEKPKQRVALYIRVSTDEQADKYGTDLQENALTGLIASKPNDFVLAGKDYIYIDDGVSGTVKLDERPAFSRLKEDLLMSPENERPFDVVAVYKIDRFARQLKILLDVIEFFEKYKVQFISANESIDTSTPFGKAMLGIVGVIAELERDTILKRTKDGRHEAFEQGVVLGNAAPYGYTKDDYKRYAELKEEADIVREIFRMFVYEGVSVDAIARYLYEHKIYSLVVSAIHHKKRKGDIRKKNELYFWGAGTVRRILGDEIYIGRIYGNKTKEGKPTEKSERILSRTPAPLVVDPLTFEKTQRLLATSKHQRRSAKDGHIYLLSGLLKCDCCYDEKADAATGRVGWHGEVKDLKKSGGRTHYYKCGRKNKSKTTTLCNAIPLPAEELENYIVEYSRKLLANPVAVFEHQKRLQSRLKTIEHLRDKDKRLLDLITAIPHKRKLLGEQHSIGFLKTPALQEALKNTEEDYARYKKERDEVQMQITQHTISRRYIDALDLFSEKYQPALEKGFADRHTISVILHELIEEIVVYTRPVRKGDPVAGRKKADQQIPHRIHIKLKLPSDILNRVGKQEVYLTETIEPTTDPSSGSKSVAGAR